ncbi:MAG: hypothetical protein JOZ67_09660 [Gammaproteobacteria bacterium]|nr:hypothetical protein [Gammaproteobacteria bacterium]
MRELVIVVSDLYLADESDARMLLPEPGSVAGLERLASRATRRRIGGGWRAWVAAWVGREDLAPLAPAYLAALAVSEAPVAPGTAWFATPVHLRAGLSSVHLPAEGLQHLPREEKVQLIEAFARDFGSAGYSLSFALGGELLLRTPRPWQVRTREPARSLGAELPRDAASGPDAPALRRLTAELEMWLHTLPLNAARVSRGEWPVSGLWIWGGDGAAGVPEGGARALPGAWGGDAYLAAVWHLLGGGVQAAPSVVRHLLETGHTRGIIVLQLSAHVVPPSGTTALSQLDAQWLRPGLAALRRGVLGRLTLLANDRALSLSRAGLLRLWRRRRPGLSGLR